MSGDNEQTNATFVVLVSNVQCPNRRWDNLCQHKAMLVDGLCVRHCNGDMCPIRRRGDLMRVKVMAGDSQYGRGYDIHIDTLNEKDRRKLLAILRKDEYNGTEMELVI